jgi:O-glycosyl hydrolase
MSSKTGDRLSSKPELTWGSKFNSNGEVIAIDPGITYQTIDGFGASFLEAGMICLNSLETTQRGDVLTKIFDPVKGSGFSAMKTIAFKVLAAGAIHPEEGLKYAYTNGADFVCMGMYDFQVVEDVNIALNALENAKDRTSRPGRG